MRLTSSWFFLIILICLNSGAIINYVQNNTENPLLSKPIGKQRLSNNKMAVRTQKKEKITSSYLEHEPIFIDDNTDFSRLGFSGEGTPTDPYVLEGLNITSSSNNLISISGTTAYFQIQDCLLNGLYLSACGIRLSNVFHGSVNDNIIVNNSAGIILEFSSDNVMQNNIVYRSLFFQDNDLGIVLIQSSDNIIDNNTIFNIEFAVDTSESNNNHFINNRFIDVVNGMIIQGNDNKITNNSFYNIDVEGTCGISVGNSVNNTISNNIAYYMGEWGISLNFVSNCTINSNFIHDINTGIIADNSENNNFSFNVIYRTGTGIRISGSKDNLILNNTVYFNSDTGIGIQSSTRNTISSNIVFQNDINGILLFNSHSNDISRNSIYDNPNEGLHLEASNKNVVTWNDFQGNGGNQANDHGTNNIFVFNSWEGWDEPDNDANGFVDDPYLIGIENQDTFPVIGPITHVILPPIISSVQRGDIYNGSWNIQWTPAIDSFDHQVYYSLFYSSDGKNSWVQLGSNLTEIKYTWDTTMVPNGANYVLKIQVACSDEYMITGSLTPPFRIQNPYSPYDPTPAFGVLIIGITIIIGFGLIYSLYVKYKPQKSFTDFLQTAQIDFLRSMYHKVVIGLENIQVGVIPEPVGFPEVDVLSPTAMITYFPSDIRNELKSDIKGRTVLTLIEIAYQYPNEANPASLSRILDIPPSTLSSEIKRLSKLQYIESYTSEQALRDARYRSYTITPKGTSFLRILKGALEVSIVRIKEKDIGYVM